MKRVYHPTLASFQDVPDGDVERWVKSGWRKSPPKHINADALPEVGSGSGVAAVPSDVADYRAPETSGSSASTATTGLAQ